MYKIFDKSFFLNQLCSSSFSLSKTVSLELHSRTYFLCSSFRPVNRQKYEIERIVMLMEYFEHLLYTREPLGGVRARGGEE
jgi:hypothetical protein